MQILISLILHLLPMLFTQDLIRRLVIIMMEKLSKRTKSDIDDKILKAARKAWGIEK